MKVFSGDDVKGLNGRPYLTRSAFQGVLQKTTPPQIRQLIRHIGDSKGYVDRFVGQLPFALNTTFCEMSPWHPRANGSTSTFAVVQVVAFSPLQREK